MAHALGPAQQLPVQPDALEPVVQAEKIGDAHAAMHLGGGARDEAADLGQMRLGVRGRQRGLGGNGIEGMGRIPDQRAGRLEFGRHLGAQMLDRLEGADDAVELLALLGIVHGLFQHARAGAQRVGGQHHPAGIAHPGRARRHRWPR